MREPFSRTHPGARWIDGENSSIEWYVEGSTVDVVDRCTVVTVVDGKTLATVNHITHNHIEDKTLIAILQTKGYTVIRMAS